MILRLTQGFLDKQLLLECSQHMFPISFFPPLKKKQKTENKKQEEQKQKTKQNKQTNQPTNKTTGNGVKLFACMFVKQQAYIHP